MPESDTTQENCPPQDNEAPVGVVLNVHAHSYDAKSETAVGKLSTGDVLAVRNSLLELPSEHHVTFKFGKDPSIPSCGCPELETTPNDVSVSVADFGFSVEVTTKHVSPEIAEKSEQAQCFNIKAGVIQEKISGHENKTVQTVSSPGNNLEP